MAKLLMIDDDKDLVRTTRDYLKLDQHQVDTAHTAEDGYLLLAAAGYDLIILDWELPDSTGIQILQRLRNKGMITPILMLTGRTGVEDREAGLDSGADDYLVKPFHFKELLARVRALLRRATPQVSNILKASCLVMDTKTLTVTKDGEEIKLARSEFALLEFLMRHPNEVFSAESLISRVWPTDNAVSSESVRTCVKRLRQKIGDYKGQPIIQTLHSIGYKLHAPEMQGAGASSAN
jgi:DNA-binding response OmpR family regulator